MKDLPKENIFEVSLIGTGGGYGESVIIHLGNQNWIVVDSCIDPYTKKCLPLEYLISKGVDLAKDVRLIVCTHWHDDHILGISELFDACQSSIFSFAHVTDRAKFLRLVGLDYSKIANEVSGSSTVEINRCIEIVSARKATIRCASQDKILLNVEEKDFKATIISLSPSDFVLSEFNYEISTLITEFGKSNQKITLQSPNEKSVTLLITVNSHNVLLGSDLEVSNDNRKGWLCILDNCEAIKSKKASLFKIPHHGSENGYHKRVWDELLIPNPTTNLTPWNKGSKLPQDPQINIFLKHTDKLYITSSNLVSNKPKRRDPRVSKTINNFNNTLREIKYKHGIVRSRINVFEDNNNWNVDLFGEAQKILNPIEE